MRWMDALASVTVLEQAGGADAEVRGVQYDSRRVLAGDVFVAMRGGATDGNRYVTQALERGAAAVVTDTPATFAEMRLQRADVPVALVEHGRRALAEMSSAVFGRPQHKLKVSAVTGTNGKTTTAFLLEQMLTRAGRKCVLIGTIETRIAGAVRASEHTTPESRDLLEIFAEGVKAGCTEVVMEMSSHALEQERVWGVPVDVAIFTNLTQDHLDFHGTMEAYAAAKAKLFEGVGAAAPRVAVINVDDANGPRMTQAAAQSEVWTYGLDKTFAVTPMFLAKDVALSAQETSFEFVTPAGSAEVDSPLVGTVNVYNLCAAMTAAMARGLTLEQVAELAAALKPVSGRFETVANELGFAVVVDYAHTDDALRNLVGLARDMVSTGRVITMFGCGGDRDRMKRPKMGRVAGEASDLVVVTSDNPRSEDPMVIVEEILVGVRETEAEVVVEVDRHAAIERAVRAARPGDIVLLAGKGHEKVQIFADGAVPFDDVAVASEILRAMRDEVV